MELTALEIAEATGGTVISGDRGARARSFTMDSRLLRPGQAFVALRGSRDGHHFVADAVARGAALALVEHPVDAGGAGVTLVRVDDSLGALAQLARLARRRLPGTTVVGVTGSAGKTATKDLAAAALRGARRVHASPGSFNNESGLPLTLLAAPADTEVVVLEMGARFAGNIAALAALADPDIGVITHVGMAHAEHLNGRAGIATTKGELLEALPASGLAVLNDDCDLSSELAARTEARVLRVGRRVGAEVRAHSVVLDEELRARFMLESPWGSAEVRLNVRGEHQVLNAAMGLAVAAHLGVPVADAAVGLGAAAVAPRRMELFRAPDGVTVLNDAYNSSPTSAAGAIESLAALGVTGRRIAVLGEMRELGEHARREHETIGALAADRGIDLVIVVGASATPMAEGARAGGATVLCVPDADAAVTVTLEQVGPGDAVLVKASRAVGLERVAEALASVTSPGPGASA